MEDKIKILVVDDNDVNCFLLSYIIEARFKAVIDIASDGKEALDYVNKNSYDIIFMDIEMPVMNGIKASRIMKMDLGITTPIVFVSAYKIEDIQINYPEFDSTTLMCNKPVKVECITKFILQATS